MNTSLFDLSIRQAELAESIEEILLENGGEETAEVTLLLHELTGREEDVLEKLDAYGKVIKTAITEAAGYTAQADEVKDRAKSLTARANAKKRVAELLKERAKFALYNLGEKSVETKNKFRFTAKLNSVQPVLYDEEVSMFDIPDKYFKRTPAQLDKTMIRSELKDGETLAFAKFGEKGTHILVS